MDIRQMRYFLAIVDQGSVHRAAEHLFVAQPSVSQTIRRLEREIGTDLFLRRGRGLVLSAAGEALVGPARDVVRSLEIARATLRAVDGLTDGRLVIAAMPSQAVSPLTGQIAAFARSFPGIEIAVVAATRPDDIREALNTGAAEIGLVATRTTDSVSTDETLTGLVSQVVESQSFVLVFRPGADISDEDPIDPLSLRELRLIVGQHGTGMRRVAETIISGTSCVIAVEIEHREALLPLVLEGVGVAVVAESWAPLARTVGLEVRRLRTSETLTVSLAWKDARLSPAAMAFLELAANT